MSEEHVEVVRRVFDEAGRRANREGPVVDALNEKSLSPVYAAMDPAIEFHEDARFPEAGVYRGVEACRQYLQQFVESFDEFIFEGEEVLGLEDDRVLVLLRVITRGKDSGAAVELRGGWIFTIRDGLALKIEAFLDRKEALEAAGLEE